MKTFNITNLFRLMLLTGLFGIMTAAFAQPQVERIGGSGITVFVDRDFRGAAATYRSDIPNLARTEFNDRISSVRVGPGEEWEVCEHANYGGRCVTITGEERDLRQNSWDNMISSIRRVRAGYPNPGPDPGRQPYIVLHAETNYRGGNARYTDRTNNLFAFNNRAESVTVGRGQWQLCDGIGFGGRCVTVSQSVPNLNSLGMRDKIRSVRPVDYDTPSTRDYIVLYDQVNYRGTPSNYNSVQANISKRARSITVGAGSWQLCDGPNFTGRCETISQSVANLTPYSIGNVIRSVRPIGFVPPAPAPMNYIVIHDQVNFRGTPTNYDGVNRNITKRAGSITIGGGNWVICDGPNFTGQCMSIGENIPDMRIYNLGNTIRSIRPDRNAQQPQPSNPYITIFAQENFRGASANYNRSESNINVRAESITVSAGVWQVCSERNFAGSCEMISENMSNLRDTELRNRVRSLRPLTRQRR